MTHGRVAAVLGACAIVICAAGYAAYSYWLSKPELQALASVSWTYPQYEKYFTELAETKGGAYAFTILNDAKLAPGIDSHELGHEVGYIFYDQVGITGLPKCVHTLGDACIHALVTEEFLHQGPGALKHMADFCGSFSPNSVVYANCFHGIGHGILAYARYDFEKALPECRALYDVVLKKDPGAKSTDVWGECVGGLMMEMLQGKHDPAAWREMKPIYLPADDPLSPCDRSYVPDEVRASCYGYLNSRLVGFAGARSNGDFPHDDVYRKALGYCERVSDTDNRRACFGGVGVSFLYAVNGGDLRKFAGMPDSEMKDVQHWCAMTDDADGASACVLTVAEVLLSGGEHGTYVPARFCELEEDDTVRGRCYNDLLLSARRYLSLLQLGTLCPRLPEPYRSACYAPGGGNGLP